MIKVTVKDDDGTILQSMEYPISALVAEPVVRKPEENRKKITVAGLFGKAIKNLIINNIKDKYFGGLL